jgi:glucose-6-phosphate isomerase
MADFLVFALLVLNLLPLFVTSFTATSTSRITNPASHVVASVRKSSELRVSSTSAPPSRRTKWDENDEDDDEDDADDVAFFITKGTDSSNSLDGSDYLLQTEDYSILKADLEAEKSLLERQKYSEVNNEETNNLSKTVIAPNSQVPPPLGLGWPHNNRATLNLVHRYRGLQENESVRARTTADSEVANADSEIIGKNKDEFSNTEQQDTSNKQQQQGENPVARLWSMINPNRPQLISSCSEWKRLQKHAEHMQTLHLSDFLQDEERCNAMYATHDGVYLDYSRQRVNLDTMKFLYDLAKKQDLKGRINAMVTGEKINFTEDRAVLHTALRADRSEIGSIIVDGMDVVKEVYEVLDQIKEFTDGVRSGAIRGYTGKRLRNIVSVGIGGSYLGPEFLHECLKTEPEGIHNALGYNLRFLSNVDPVDVERTVADLDPEETLIVIVSKTFTTAETMLNARTMRQWLWDFMGKDKEVVRKHMVACASVSAKDIVEDFGIDTRTGLFRFWDFIGGRYSVCSAAGAVPISLLYGFDVFEKFLKGANSIDKHFVSAPFHRNIPVLMGLLGVWNMSFLKYTARTTLPYAEALLKLPAHIQQLDMESNGKLMTKHGLEVDYLVGEVDFGEAGTNGQHSFYQLLHMGQIVPCDFIGFIESQHDFTLEGENLSAHDELMANFFAQPDALANGKTADEVRAEGVPEHLVAHRVFKGNRPSLSLLLPKLTAYACGQLLAVYEHRTVVQGFMWDINSFDQWGVELGKKTCS